MHEKYQIGQQTKSAIDNHKMYCLYTCMFDTREYWLINSGELYWKFKYICESSVLCDLIDYILEI